VVLTTGQHVRYSIYQRPGFDAYFIRFRGPDQTRRIERSTGYVRKVDAIGAAHQIILEAFGQAAPISERMPWEEARKKLEAAMLADGKRPRTVKEYLKSLKGAGRSVSAGKGTCRHYRTHGG
jgi:hypothetical protein